jgi:glutaminase
LSRCWYIWVAAEAKWRFIQDGLSRFGGRALELGEEVYASASVANHHNRAIASLLQSAGRIYWDPAEAIDLFTRQSCLMVTAADLAVMGATLADGGVNPLTGARVAQQAVCHYALAVMATAGMYESQSDDRAPSGHAAASARLAGGIGWLPPGADGHDDG